jgi:hypothetical protein
VHRRTFNFGVAMRYWVLILFLGFSSGVFAQGKAVDGIVFDKQSKERIAIVDIVNATTGKSIYDNLKGEYHIEAKQGDVLIFSKQNYFSDTVKVLNYTSQAIYLKRSSIQLNQVNIQAAALTPEQQLENTKHDYNKAYGSLAYNNLLSLSPGSGAGLSIDALYNAFSREGRNAAHLREEIQNDYYQNAIDYRYTRTLVNRITGLKDQQLTTFMQRYRPGYWFVENANDYDFVTYIKNNYKRFLRRPKGYTLQPLVPGK